ncbi:MAG: dehypoxanthine futalosine cyclase [Euryarchaeota archaeon]|nr:dehypoxanthine futalosine cyclase [Euryarchaeota archaeon]DAC29315.1 MAG TPA: CofH family radical SAM protein [Candidatus Poseidoniales archaeon]HII45438.1 CofH family radical SAM protein [Candidatus Poseidoniaceae archaeon]
MNWQSILQRQQNWTLHNANNLRLTIDEASELYENAPLHELTMAADIRRQKLHPGGQVTYLVDRNVNYTNVCTINCQFCSFYRPPGHKETYTQSFDEISQRITELEEIGGSRILMQGGVNPELEFSWYLELISYLVENHPKIQLDCFSPIEIEGIAEVSGMTTLEVLTQLQAAGLHGLPGGGAEMLVEEVRKDISPKKGNPDNWLRVMQEAQSLGLTTSATNVFGFGETLRQRVEHMSRIRELQDRSINHYDNGFTSFIAWPVQLESNSFGRRNRGQNKHVLGAGPTEYIRHIAVSRLFFDNISSIQASWPTMGLGVAQMALMSGANDAGSTMMEENVVSASGTTKLSASEIELQNTIIRAGFIPVKRDSDYNSLPTEIVAELEKPLAAPMPLQY